MCLCFSFSQSLGEGIHSYTIKNYAHLKLFIDAFTFLRNFLFLHSYFFFYHERVNFFQMLFLHSLQWLFSLFLSFIFSVFCCYSRVAVILDSWIKLGIILLFYILKDSAYNFLWFLPKFCRIPKGRYLDWGVAGGCFINM